MRWFSSVSLVEFNPFLLTISFCSYPTHVYYSTKISKTISVCAPGMQGVFYFFLFFFGMVRNMSKDLKLECHVDKGGRVFEFLSF